MAFAKGKETVEIETKRYIGIAPVFILDVNPNKDKLKEYFGYEQEEEPSYTGEFDVEGKKVPYARITFIAKTYPQKCNGIEWTTRVNLLLRKEYKYKKDRSKIKVIDKYGRTGWVTPDELKSHAIPRDKNGNLLQLDADYRPLYDGEEELTNFIKCYLGLNNVMKYVNKTWVMVDKPEECEARIDDMEALFKGNFDELRHIINLQPQNKVKVLFGVKTTENGLYQDNYNKMFLKYNSSDYKKISEDLQQRKSVGSYPNTEFVIDTLREYSVKPTDLSEVKEEDSPFNEDESPWS